ncbi:MAG: hypothetical protein ACYTGH_15190 [Planctomycetota bacterium]|jgi:tetratricopeptide (TPR) repeat protein
MQDETRPLDEVTIPLPQYLDGRGRLSLEESLGLLGSIAQRVAFAHERGEVFGVITPDQVEILLGTGLCVEILTPAPNDRISEWTAPEAVAGVALDGRSDLYSLGLLLRSFMTGSVKGNPRRLPESLSTFYRLCLEENADQRFQTAGMLLRRLKELQPEAESLEEEWVALNISVRVRLATKVRAWAGRQWVAICLAFALAVIAGVAITHHVMETRRIEEERARRLDVWKAAEEAYGEGRYRDAIGEYSHFIGLGGAASRQRKSWRRLIDSYRRLEDPQQELQALVRYVTLYPDSGANLEYNSRIVELTGEAIGRFGGVVAIGADRVMVVDGKPDDWEGIKPILFDKPKDCRTPPSDLVAFYAVVTGETMVVRMDTTAPPDGEGFAFCLGIDADPKTFTDTVADWDYELAFSARLAPWFWDLRHGRTYENSKSTKLTGARFAAGEVVEASFPLATINTPKVFSLRAKSYNMSRRRDADEMPRKVILSTGVK